MGVSWNAQKLFDEMLNKIKLVEYHHTLHCITKKEIALSHHVWGVQVENIFLVLSLGYKNDHIYY